MVSTLLWLPRITTTVSGGGGAGAAGGGGGGAIWATGWGLGRGAAATGFGAGGRWLYNSATRRPEVFSMVLSLEFRKTSWMRPSVPARVNISAWSGVASS